MASSLTEWYWRWRRRTTGGFWENAARSLHLYPLMWICCVYRISCTLVLAVGSIFSLAHQLRLLYNSFDHSSCSILSYHSGFFPTVEAASFCGCGCFCWALPLFSVLCLLLLVCFLMTKRKSGWGICGSSVVVVLLWHGCCPSIWPQCHIRFLIFLTLLFLLGPSLERHRPNRRKKKDCHRTQSCLPLCQYTKQINDDGHAW